MSLYPIAAYAQTASADISFGAAIIGVIVTLLGTYALFVRKVVDTHFDNISGMQLRLQHLETEQDEFIEQIGTLKGQLDQADKDAQERKRDYDRRIEGLEKKLHEKEDENRTLQGRIDQLDKDLKDLQTRYGQVLEERDSYQAALRVETELREKYQQELRDNHAMISDMKREIKDLQEKAGIVESNGDDNDPAPAAEVAEKKEATAPDPTPS